MWMENAIHLLRRQLDETITTAKLSSMKMNARLLVLATALIIGFGTTAVADEQKKNEELAQQVKEVMELLYFKI